MKGASRKIVSYRSPSGEITATFTPCEISKQGAYWDLHYDEGMLQFDIGTLRTNGAICTDMMPIQILEDFSALVRDMEADGAFKNG